MFEKLKEVEKRFEKLSELLCKPETISNQELFRKYSKEQADLQELVAVFRMYEKTKKQLDDNRSLISSGEDAELAEMAREENRELKPKLAALENNLKLLLVPSDPDDSKNIIIEIRAGTGGEEAGLFAAELFSMYGRYAAEKGFRVETLSVSHAQAGGIKEVIASIEGRNVYKTFKFESGVHRVQRVPKTETQGRIHTSAVTVAVLPEAEEKEVSLNPNDLKVDVYRSSGPGGQSVNTTDSAVRITHIPTGIVVAMQDEKSQLKNRAKAMKVLLTRVQSFFDEQDRKKQAESRKAQVGTGDRSERIRTYNFPQGRVTDHRINLTLYSLESVMLGELDELVENLQRAQQTKQLAAAAEKGNDIA